MPLFSRRVSYRLRRVLRVPAEIVVAVFLILDSLIAPLFGPVMRALSRLRIIQRLEAAIAALPPYAILVLLVVPFAIAEVAKAYAVVLMAQERFVTGVAIFIGAYIVSILVCERIFHAGRAPLMTIGWFRRAFDWIMALKARIFDMIRTTAAWRAAQDLRDRARDLVRRLRPLVTRRTAKRRQV